MLLRAQAVLGHFCFVHASHRIEMLSLLIYPIFQNVNFPKNGHFLNNNNNNNNSVCPVSTKYQVFNATEAASSAHGKGARCWDPMGPHASEGPNGAFLQATSIPWGQEAIQRFEGQRGCVPILCVPRTLAASWVGVYLRGIKTCQYKDCTHEYS